MWVPIPVPDRQCCRSGMLIPYPGSGIRIFPSRIYGQNHSRICIRTKDFFSQKIVSKLSEIWSGMFIPDLYLDFLPVLDPGSRGQKGGSGSATLPIGMMILFQFIAYVKYTVLIQIQVYWLIIESGSWDFFCSDSALLDPDQDRQ